MSLEGPPAAEAQVEALGAKAPGILSELESDLGVRYRERFRMVVIPASGPRDTSLARLDAEAPEWAAGYLLPEARVGAIRVALASRYPYGTLESVLAHEATHMLLHDAGTHPLPLWFEEGLATWEGRRWTLEDAMIYSSSLLTADLPALSQLDRGFHGDAGEAERAYAASFAFVSRAIRSHGPDFPRRLLAECRQRPFEEAWRIATGQPLAEAERTWRRDSLIRYRWLPVLTASSTLWIGITFLALFVGARKRERARRQRELWDKEEADSGEPAFFEESGGEGATHSSITESEGQSEGRSDS